MIRLVDPDALFFDLSIFSHDPLNWAVMLDQADAVFLCGNPRFDRSNYPHFWVTELWDHFADARAHGILTGDFFAGCASPLPLDAPQTESKLLLTYPRNAATARAHASLDALVCRDRSSFLISDSPSFSPLLFPCSTFWASSYFGIKPFMKTHNAVIIPSLYVSKDLIRSLRSLVKRIPNDLPTYLVAHCRSEFLMLRELLPDYYPSIILSDPESLLRFLSTCDHLISCRLHASIPALSLGCKLLHVAVDSRSRSLDLFNVPYVPMTSVLSGNFSFSFFDSFMYDPPGLQPFFAYFKSHIMEKLP